MSNGNDSGGNRTVFRPSPLQGLGRGQQPPAAPGQAPAWGSAPASNTPAWGSAPSAGGWEAPSHYEPAPAQPAYAPPPPPSAAQPAPQPRMRDDDVPQPSKPQDVRNRLMSEAAPLLALASSVRSGRARTPMPELHRQASAAIATFDRAIAGHYPEEIRQRAKYALCATMDDIAQNLPGSGMDAAEWARRSMVVQFFQENIGGDRFWQLTDDMLARPAQSADIIELFHACLAAGFEGRFRIMPDGKRRLYEIASRLYAALEFPRSLSSQQMVTAWPGEKAPLKKVGLWGYVALAAAAAAAVLLLVYILLRVLLMAGASDPFAALGKINPDAPLRLSRAAAPPPQAAASPQADKLTEFLAPEIAQGLVKVEEDASTVRVRTTVGQLFQSASDQLDEGREALFHRIGKAIQSEPGQVTVEGHADSDRVSTLAFPDNTTLSKARADTVANIIKSELSDPARVVSEGYGEARPIASNDTAEGKSLNRRVEVVVPRRN
ncbi:type IVB secretion system protein IcmH/DotU [Sphingomonas jatrophae]|uniref:Type VI secretion system protein ImpK n=1 Tax=Sphingomonas jatrophae TaxID=1166337 RepID=A0A1I6LKG4_9SPHN|nr:type IVB secretion system protein IcmH/DotU [Sphingomonas jatrophae]SFS03873.1 type VI secretion system protein ImpK [Sphingomonas jatrophae]